MPKVNVQNLQPGDIVIFQWDDIRWHTAVYVGQHAGEHAIAHAGALTTCIEGLQQNMDTAVNVYAFRAPNAKQAAAQRAMVFVNRWCTVTTTRYSEPRGSGVLKSYDRFQPGTAPAFEYDALYRVFKWLCRQENQQFSQNRGTTCCAFVIACFQAGFMQEFLEDATLGHATETLFGLLHEARGSKNKPDFDKARGIFESELGKKKVKVTFGEPEWEKIRARRQFSNPGTKSKDYRVPLEELWASLKQGLLFWAEPTTLENIFTAPLFCDAKFTYSCTLYENLRANGSDWTQIN